MRKRFVRADLYRFSLALLQGNKCVFNLCRGCCKKKAYKEVADCPGEFTPLLSKNEEKKNKL